MGLSEILLAERKDSFYTVFSQANGVFVSGVEIAANGNAYAEVTATLSQEIKDALLAGGACPNTNWAVGDAVPCTATITDQETDANGCIIADATFDCTLPGCETLGWDIATQMFERRQYDCVRMSYNRYRTPVCP